VKEPWFPNSQLILFLNFIFRCTFSSAEQCLEWGRKITKATVLPKQIEDNFAFAFHAWACDEEGGSVMSYLSTRERVPVFMDEVWLFLNVVGSIPVTTEFFLISCDSNQVSKWFGTHCSL